MTCIIGIVKGNKVWLGGDSAGTSGNGEQRLIGDKKVFLREGFAFGVCGSPKAMDALRFNVVLPTQTTKDDREFMSTAFVQAFKEGLQQAGCLENEQFQGEILVGYKGNLYRIQGNLQVITTACGFDAVGAGADIAMGSLHATVGDRDTKKRITTALNASALHNATVRPPFAIVCVK